MLNEESHKFVLFLSRIAMGTKGTFIGDEAQNKRYFLGKTIRHFSPKRCLFFFRSLQFYVLAFFKIFHYCLGYFSFTNLPDDSLLEHRGLLHLNYPIRHGIISDWDEMELVRDLNFSIFDFHCTQHLILTDMGPHFPQIFASSP